MYVYKMSNKHQNDIVQTNKHWYNWIQIVYIQWVTFEFKKFPRLMEAFSSLRIIIEKNFIFKYINIIVSGIVLYSSLNPLEAKI